MRHIEGLDAAIAAIPPQLAERRGSLHTIGQRPSQLKPETFWQACPFLATGPMARLFVCAWQPPNSQHEISPA